MSLSNSLRQLEQALGDLQDNFEKSVATLLDSEQSVSALREAVRSVVQAALSDDKTPLGSDLALQQTISSLSSTSDDSSFDIIIVGDLNRFKPLNDTHGHIAGDFAIRRVGEMIREFFVGACQALAFRPHGDEFVILLKREFIENFKAKVSNFAECRFEFEGEQLETAVSFGSAIRDDEADFETLFKKADAACQKAKRMGDGVLVEWSEQIETDKPTEFRRIVCGNCGTETACYVPAHQVTENGKPSFCPWCGKQL